MELTKNVSTLDSADTSKGITWQYIVLSRLMHFKGKTVAEFVNIFYQEQKIVGGPLPDWTKTAIINVQFVGSPEVLFLAKQINSVNFGEYAEVEIISQWLSDPDHRQCILVPVSSMRPDGVHIGSLKNNSLEYWTLLVSAKFLASNLSGNSIKDDKASTDWKQAYQPKNANSKRATNVIDAFANAIRPFRHRGSLRVHFIMPGLATAKDGTDVRGGCRVENGDVIMYLDAQMLDIFFSKRVAECVRNLQRSM